MVNPNKLHLGVPGVDKTRGEAPLLLLCATKNTRFRPVQLFTKQFQKVSSRKPIHSLANPYALRWSSYKTVRRTGTVPDGGNKVRGTNHRVTSVQVALEYIDIETLRYPGEDLRRDSLKDLKSQIVATPGRPSTPINSPPT